MSERKLKETWCQEKADFCRVDENDPAFQEAAKIIKEEIEEQVRNEAEEQPALKINIDGVEKTVVDYWWEERDFHFVADDKRYCLKNTYLTDIKFGGLEYDSSENTEIELTLKYSREKYERSEG